MPKLPPSTMKAQKDIIRRCENAESGGVDKIDIARAAGVEPCILSKWITDGVDQREMPWSAVRKLARMWGWDVVLGEDATADGWDIEAVSTVPAPDKLRAGILVSSEAGDVPQLIVTLMAAGTLDTPEGRAAVLREIREVRAPLDALEAAIASRRVSA